MAKLDLELNRDVEPLPVDSTVLIRNRSSLGLKYVEITPGESDEGYEAGATIPPTAARPHPVELDQVLNTFNERTRIAAQQNLRASATRSPAAARTSTRRSASSRRCSTRSARRRQPRLAADQPRRILPRACQRPPPRSLRWARRRRSCSSASTRRSPRSRASRRIIPDTISAAPATLAEGTRTLPRCGPFLEHSARLLHAPSSPGAEALGGHLADDRQRPARGVPVLSESPRSTVSSSRPPTRCSTFRGRPGSATACAS